MIWRLIYLLRRYDRGGPRKRVVGRPTSRQGIKYACTARDDPEPCDRVCHVSARRKNVCVKIYCTRRTTYGSTSGPSQSVENTPLATQLHHANVAWRIRVVSSVSTGHNVSYSRWFLYFPIFFSYNNTTASSRRSSCVPVRLKETM